VSIGGLLPKASVSAEAVVKECAKLKLSPPKCTKSFTSQITGAEPRCQLPYRPFHLFCKQMSPFIHDFAHKFRTGLGNLRKFIDPIIRPASIDKSSGIVGRT
jgi:hypothetical protein